MPALKGGGAFFRSMQDNSNNNGLDLSSVPKQPEGKAPLPFLDFHNGFHIKGGHVPGWYLEPLRSNKPIFLKVHQSPSIWTKNYLYTPNTSDRKA